MKRKVTIPPRPTPAELEILRILWNRGPCSVREVLGELRKARPTGYTTALKLLQIMAAKGLVSRDDHARAHLYRAAVAEEATQRTLVSDLIARAFGGDAPKLVMHALETGKLTSDELAEIRTLIDSIKETKR